MGPLARSTVSAGAAASAGWLELLVGLRCQSGNLRVGREGEHPREPIDEGRVVSDSGKHVGRGRLRVEGPEAGISPLRRVRAGRVGPSPGRLCCGVEQPRCTSAIGRRHDGLGLVPSWNPADLGPGVGRRCSDGGDAEHRELVGARLGDEEPFTVG